jgi:VCBS repeat-containing protein
MMAVDTSNMSSATLNIYIDGTRVAIPANVGVNANDTHASVFTTAADGKIFFENTNVTLGNFFDTWRTNAGLAGNNANAILSSSQVMNAIEDRDSHLQLFVNGQLSEDFANQDIDANDSIVLVYSSNTVVSLNTNFGAIVIELFDDETPGTVANFLNYVNDGDYINSFFHRSAKLQNGEDFVIQGGGFKTNSTTFTNTSQFSNVPTDPPIQNEPGISNKRGTVAMAKTSDPNSATSQFFVNLNDDNDFLDDPNNSGGFTVFGQVLDMTIADTIADIPVRTNNSAPYGELPVNAQNQLSVVQSVEGEGEVNGFKFRDLDGDGIKDANEPGAGGITVWADANNNGTLDSGEVSATTAADGFFELHLEPGTYAIRSQVSTGFADTLPGSSTSLSATVEIGGSVTGLNFGEQLIAPTGVALVSTSDTGVSNSDNLTKLNNSSASATLQFTVSGTATGAEVRVYAGGTLVGTATATGSQTVVTTNGSTALANGSVSITATQVVGGVESSISPALSITVDATAPAGFTTTPPSTTRFNQPFTYDANSPDEGLANLTYSLGNAPSGMTINNQGIVNWTPTLAQSGPASFQILLTDAAGNSALQDVDLTVFGLLPASPDTYSVNEDTALVIDIAASILLNDGDEGSGTLTAQLVASPAHGTITLNPNGSFTYTPTPNFFGTDVFTYTASDGSVTSNVAEVTITVLPVADPPAPVADSYSTNEDTTLTVNATNGVLANDVDVDGDTLTVALGATTSNGTLSLASNGSFTYTPNANFFGADSFTYTVSDGTTTSSPITVTLNVTAVNDLPVAGADAYSVNEDGVLNVDASLGVLTNDTDSDSTLTAAIATQPSHGTVIFNSNGSFSYTPNANFFGTDTFTYMASDGTAQSTATVTITVNGQPDPPTAVADSFTVTKNSTVQTFNVLSNDSSSPDGTQTLTLVSTSTGSAGGTISINGSSINYTPAANFVGTETFTYTVQDTDNLPATATVTVTVQDSNTDNSISGFVFIDKNNNGIRDTGEAGLPGSLLRLTGTDNLGQSVNRTAISDNTGAYSFSTVRTGTYKIEQQQPEATIDGAESTTVAGAVTTTNDQISNIVINTNNNFAGNNFGEKTIKASSRSIRWYFTSAPPRETLVREAMAKAEEKAGDASLAAAIRTSATELTNRAPTTVNDAYTIVKGGTLNVNATNGVLKNDTDIDGDALTVEVVTGPANGTFTLNANGSFTYKPNATFTGTDTVTYRAKDGSLTTNGTITFTVNTTVNIAPQAANDTYNATEDVTLTINAATGVLNNDTDADGQPLTAAIVTQPAHGAVTLNADGSFTYVPTANYNGPDSFTYLTNDGITNSANATVNITVAAVADPPKANNDSYSIAEDSGTLTVTEANGVLNNDNDPDGDTLGQAIFVNNVTHGTLALNGNGSFTYTPSPNFSGTDTFTYTMTANGVVSNTATVTIVVSPVEDPTTAGNDTYTMVENSTLDPFVADGVLKNDSDGDGNFSLRVTTESTHGTVEIRDNGTFKYIPNDNFNGVDTFVYEVKSGSSTATATVTITVTDGNEIPTAANDTSTVNEDDSVIIDVKVNDIEPEGQALTVTILNEPTNGEAIVNANGTVTYTPDDNFNGMDSFTYKVNDGFRDSPPATVNITVNPINDAPVTVADNYSMTEGQVLTTTIATGVLANDIDPEGNTMTVSLVQGQNVTNGTLTLNPDGTFTYTPAVGFVGTDEFKYVVSDGILASAATIVQITVADEEQGLLASIDEVFEDEEDWLLV